MRGDRSGGAGPAKDVLGVGETDGRVDRVRAVREAKAGTNG
ncbi:hypothetical protein [Stappia sp. ES.058]|nr:hypothetical protein [Stappia sp. ES.058]